MKKISVSGIVKLLAASVMVVFMMGCEQPSDKSDDENSLSLSDVVPLFEVSWNGAFNPAYSSTGVTIEVADGATLWTSEGAMSQCNGAEDGHTMVQAGGYFASGTAVNWGTVGGAWNGVFAKSESATVDVSSATNAYVAVKGMPEGIAYFELQLASGTPVVVNVMNYPSVTDGEWTIYVVPLADYSGVNPAALMQVGVWNPNLVNSNVDTERNTPTTNFPAIAAGIMYVSVAFGE